ncbi:MAG: DsbA family protein [Gammaproteobacteria bacterium]|nr:DsbA family protein [Gammaproteobacteria bacterium]
MPDNIVPPVLIYVHDPMCSWCWAFRPVWQAVTTALPDGVGTRLLLGGLAPDTDDPMPEPMREYLQQTWRTIQLRVPNTRFNFDFWVRCKPRRSTYPACRAVIAARTQVPALESSMITAIQRVYYQGAMNPSDDDILIQLAIELGLDCDRFSVGLHSPSTIRILKQEIEGTGRLGVTSFPALVLETSHGHWPIAVDYRDSQSILRQVTDILSSI